MPLDFTGLRALPAEECLTLLRLQKVGRVALTMKALPTVLPVNYRVVGNEIVFRTGTGTKLSAALDRNVVAFEIDFVDDNTQRGWSVVIVGPTRVITEPDEIAALEDAHVQTWLQTPPSHYVAIRMAEVSGRSLAPPDPPEPLTSNPSANLEG